MQPLDLRSVVIISTAHVSEETAKRLDATPVEEWPWAGGRYASYGWFLYAHDENAFAGEDAIPDDLYAAMTWARTQGCEYLLIDCDADIVDGLAVYDW